MKRLLAYLFIVLGLGLTFSVSAHAAKSLCIVATESDKIFIDKRSNKKMEYSCEINTKQQKEIYLKVKKNLKKAKEPHCYYTSNSRECEKDYT